MEKLNYGTVLLSVATIEMLKHKMILFAWASGKNYNNIQNSLKKAP